MIDRKKKKKLLKERMNVVKKKKQWMKKSQDSLNRFDILSESDQIELNSDEIKVSTENQQKKNFLSVSDDTISRPMNNSFALKKQPRKLEIHSIDEIEKINSIDETITTDTLTTKTEVYQQINSLSSSDSLINKNFKFKEFKKKFQKKSSIYIPNQEEKGPNFFQQIYYNWFQEAIDNYIPYHWFFIDTLLLFKYYPQENEWETDHEKEKIVSRVYQSHLLILEELKDEINIKKYVRKKQPVFDFCVSHGLSFILKCVFHAPYLFHISTGYLEINFNHFKQAIYSGSIDTILQIWQNIPNKHKLTNSFASYMLDAIRTGSKEIIQTLETILENQEGKMAVYLLRQNKKICAIAADTEQWGLLKWLRSLIPRYEWSSQIVLKPIVCKNLDILKWMIHPQNRPSLKCHQLTVYCEAACRLNNFEALKILIDHGYNYDQWCFYHTVKNKNYIMAYYLRFSDPPCPINLKELTPFFPDLKPHFIDWLLLQIQHYN